MQNTTVALVWHMHQPYYRDMVTGESSMPWCRLHGIHSYYDMLRLYQRFPSVRGTINFVPSLVEQLLAYTEGGKSDAFLDHTRVPASDLTFQHKVFLLRHFFMANYDRKIAMCGPYSKLHARLGIEHNAVDFNQAVRFFSTQDYLDLQVYYNLVWFGFAAREEIPELTQMLSGGGHFTEEDKAFVLDAQFRILRSLLEELKKTAASENVEICTTPYYHPILPLLIDTDIARRANPKAPLPPRFKMPQIAEAQVVRALDSMERWVGVRPRGMWPAEGSVCPEIIPILAGAGVKWIATDDRVLARSLSYEERATSMHQPFTATADGASIGIVFRDHGLSDLISFTYSRMPAAAAVADFMGHVKEIAGYAKGSKRLITVILDGENPWEFYPEDGKEFLTELFAAFEREGVATTSVGRYLDEHPPQKTITSLHSGSWIDANFNIWIGKPQKNTAWSFIKRTADELLDNLGPEARAKNPQAELAFQSLCAACGSDWFWWYDDDFESAYKGDFDRIFRGHLKNAFTLAGADVPLFLFEPIYRFEEQQVTVIEPAGCIDPVIDGKETTFFEWANATHLDVHGRGGGAMALTSTDPFESIFFGFNEHSFFLRIDPVNEEAGFRLDGDETLTLSIYDGTGRVKLYFAEKEGALAVSVKAAENLAADASIVTFAADRVLEMGIAFEALKLAAGDKVTLAIALQRHGVELRRFSHIHFVVPDETYRLRMWTV